MREIFKKSVYIKFLNHVLAITFCNNVCTKSSLTILAIVLLMVSSCKKKPVRVGHVGTVGQDATVIYKKHKVKDEGESAFLAKEGEEVALKNNSADLSKNQCCVGEKKDMFSPVSECQAKQFVNNLNSCINFGNNSSDNNFCEKNVLFAEKEFTEFVRQIEAKLYDVPVPMSSEPIKEYFNFVDMQKNIVLGYLHTMSTFDIIKFYTQEMERLGWKNIYVFDGLPGVEKLLLFQKPSKLCAVLIERYKKKGSCALHEGETQEQAKIVIFTQV